MAFACWELIRRSTEQGEARVKAEPVLAQASCTMLCVRNAREEVTEDLSTRQWLPAGIPRDTLSRRRADPGRAHLPGFLSESLEIPQVGQSALTLATWLLAVFVASTFPCLK